MRKIAQIFVCPSESLNFTSIREQYVPQHEIITQKNFESRIGKLNVSWLEKGYLRGLKKSMICPVSSECFISFQVKCWLNNQNCDNIVEPKQLVIQRRISTNEINKPNIKHNVEEFKHPLSDRNGNDNADIPEKCQSLQIDQAKPVA